MVDYLNRPLDPKKPDGSPVIPIDTVATQSAVAPTSAATSAAFAPRATDPIQDGKSTAFQDPKKLSSNQFKNLPKVLPNVMEQFSSFNILWTLAALPPSQFNNPASYRDSPSRLTNIVFSSGGRFDSQRVNTLFGRPEYFVNNFVMNNIIAASEATGNSNAIKFSFEIIEPHSMGLLLQSMQAAAINAGYLSYLANCPYVLRMDIQGFDELGVNISSVKPKFFVLKLTSMKFTVTEGGSNYKVEGIPYNQQAFSDVINISYTDISLSGNGTETVESVLQSSPKGLAAVLNGNEKRLVDEKQITFPDIYSIQFPVQSHDWYSSGGKRTVINKATVNPQEEENEGDIELFSSLRKAVDDFPVNEIGQANLFDTSAQGTRVFKSTRDTIDEKSGVVKRDGLTIDPKQRMFQFGQKTPLTGMLNQIVLSSNYAFRAIDPQYLAPGGFIKWFKLDGQIELLEEDPLTGDYAKKITYRVVPYFIHHSIFSNVNAAPVGYHELMKEIRKEYQYIYTGQNVDVLKFDIEINNLFYTAANPQPEKDASKTGNQDAKDREILNKNTPRPEGNAAASQAAQLGRARPHRSPRLLKGYKGGSSSKSVEQNVAETMHQALISGNSADMISVNLEIMGDPYWLVDSGMSNYFAGIPTPTSQITNDGTMNYEGGNVNIYLNFITPSDIDETTGLYQFSQAGRESPFGGIYRVVMCENTFADGQWKQKLKCLRMPGPQGPEVTKVDATGKITKQDSLAVQVGSQEPAKNSPINDTNVNTGPPAKPSSPAPSPTSGRTSDDSRRTDRQKKTETKTTSNQAQPRTGFKYYRDLGQG